MTLTLKPLCSAFLSLLLLARSFLPFSIFLLTLPFFPFSTYHRFLFIDSTLSSDFLCLLFGAQMSGAVRVASPPLILTEEEVALVVLNYLSGMNATRAQTAFTQECTDLLRRGVCMTTGFVLPPSKPTASAAGAPPPKPALYHILAEYVQLKAQETQRLQWIHSVAPAVGGRSSSSLPGRTASAATDSLVRSADFASRLHDTVSSLSELLCDYRTARAQALGTALPSAASASSSATALASPTVAGTTSSTARASSRAAKRQAAAATATTAAFQAPPARPAPGANGTARSLGMSPPVLSTATHPMPAARSNSTPPLTSPAPSAAVSSSTLPSAAFLPPATMPAPTTNFTSHSLSVPSSPLRSLSHPLPTPALAAARGGASSSFGAPPVTPPRTPRVPFTPGLTLGMEESDDSSGIHHLIITQ
jgi:hypothetical protein